MGDGGTRIILANRIGYVTLGKMLPALHPSRIQDRINKTIAADWRAGKLSA